MTYTSNNPEYINKGQLLTYLVNSFSEAEKSLMIIGPWIDMFFVKQITNSLNNDEILVQFIIRTENGEIDESTRLALNLAGQNIHKFEVKSLEMLHSKLILVDDEIFYLGSTNWFHHSLNNPLEITLKGEISSFPELASDIKYYWKTGNSIKKEEIIEFRNFTPIIDLIIEDVFDFHYILLNDPDSKNRAHVAYLLGETKNTQYLEILCEITNDEDGKVRRMAASALNKIGDQRAEPTLIKLLNDTDPQVRQYAAKALGNLGTSKCIKHLLNLTNDKDQYVSESAKIAISKINKTK